MDTYVRWLLSYILASEVYNVRGKRKTEYYEREFKLNKTEKGFNVETFILNLGTNIP